MNLFLAVLTCVSFALTFWCWVVSRRFPLHKPVASEPPHPALTLLKPLKGVEENTKKCLTSWFSQDYPDSIQILFGVACADDPVCDAVRALMAEFPKVDARLVICDQPLAVNRKVSTLMQLESSIAHDYIIISDADVSVPPDFLRHIAPLLKDPEAGLVNCFYRHSNPTTLAMKWEALAVNSDFWSQVLQARSLKEVDFALGAVMSLSRERLTKLGGFAALSHFLADDYQLGHQVARNGGRIVFSPVVVDCWESSATWSEAWKHQLRWARTVRACQPFPYFLSIINNATLWPCLWQISRITSLGSSHETSIGIFIDKLPVGTICATAVAFRILSSLDMHRRLTQSNNSLFYWWLVPIKDLLNVPIWALSFLGNRIEWRGERYRLVKGGKLVKIEISDQF